MAVPPPLREPDENTARGLQRVSAGVQQGRRAGLAAVRRAGGASGRVPPSAGSGFLYDPNNYYFSRWDGTLNSNESARTELLTPSITEGTPSPGVEVIDGYIAATAPGLYHTSWIVSMSGRGTAVPLMCFTPSTSTTLYFHPTGEDGPGFNAPSTIPLQAGSVIKATLINFGPTDDIDYTIMVWVYPLFVQ